MSTTAEKIMSEAMALSPQARAFIAERLIESLDVAAGDTIAPVWFEEIRRRCQDVESGAVKLRDASDVFAKAHATVA